SLLTALMPKAVIPKWCRTDFHVAGQSGFTGGISCTDSTFQPSPAFADIPPSSLENTPWKLPIPRTDEVASLRPSKEQRSREENAMVRCETSMSLDGFIAGPN